MRPVHVVAVFLLLAASLFLAGCGARMTTARSAEMTGGDPDRGAELIVHHGCISCHIIPGVPGVNAMVGPPLNAWANRGYIAGALANTPDNLILWIQYPQSVEPGTVMPNQGLSEEEARHIAAYLYTLRR